MLELNRLYLMDCIDGMKMLDDACVDLTITSPPYDNLREYNGYSFDVVNVSNQLYRITKIGGVVVWIVNDQMIDGSETLTSFSQAFTFKETGFNVHDTMIWRKISPFQHKNRYIQNFEYMFVFSKGSPKTANLICDRPNIHAGQQIHGTERQPNGDTRPLSSAQKCKCVKEFGARYNVWDIQPEKNNRTCHPAVFPVKLVTDHILSWSNENDVIIDPFSGSGTTCLAALKTNRKYVGFEISENYHHAAIERLEAEKAQCNLFLTGD